MKFSYVNLINPKESINIGIHVKPCILKLDTSRPRSLLSPAIFMLKEYSLYQFTKVMRIPVPQQQSGKQFRQTVLFLG